MTWLSRFTFLILIVAVTACGPRDALDTTVSQATSSVGRHPLVGTWASLNTTQELVIHANGAAISEQCGSQAIVGDVQTEDRASCGGNSRMCGSFPYIVANATTHPACIEAGSYICYFNVYTTYNKEYLALNCTDGKGVSYFSKQD